MIKNCTELFGDGTYEKLANFYPGLNENTTLEEWDIGDRQQVQYQSIGMKREIVNVDNWRGGGLDLLVAFFKNANVLVFEKLPPSYIAAIPKIIWDDDD